MKGIQALLNERVNSLPKKIQVSSNERPSLSSRDDRSICKNIQYSKFENFPHNNQTNLKILYSEKHWVKANEEDL